MGDIFFLQIWGFRMLHIRDFPFVFDTPWQDFGPSIFHMGGLFFSEGYERDVTYLHFDGFP